MFCYNFGVFAAQQQAGFFAPTPGCTAIGPEKNYVAISVTDGHAILVATDENRHLKPGYLAKNVSDLPCGLEFAVFGTIQK